MAVTGRPVLGAGEIRRMIVAENIVRAYRRLEETGDWAKFAEENPDTHALLMEAMRLADDD